MRIILTILVICSLAFPQDLPGWSFYGGLGMNNAKISESGAPSPKPLMGMLAGVSKGVMLGGMPLFVGAGIGQRGYKVEFSKSETINEIDEETGMEITGEMSVSMKGKFSLNYLDAWVVMPYPVGPGMFWAGPGVGIFLNGKAKGKMEMEMELLGIPISQSESINEDIEEGFDDLEFGLILGYSYPLPIMDGKLNLNAGYYLGLVEHEDTVTFNSIFAHLNYRL